MCFNGGRAHYQVPWTPFWLPLSSVHRLGAGRGGGGNFAQPPLKPQPSRIDRRKNSVPAAWANSYLLLLPLVYLVFLIFLWFCFLSGEMILFLFYYRKGGRASYIVREVRSEREREREKDGSDVTLVALKLAMNFAPFLAKNLHLSIGEEFCTFPCQKFAP